MPYPYYQAIQPYIQQSFQPTQQSATNGIITVRNKEEAISYPIAPGNSLTFKHETEPYIYTKTLGFSQLDQPIFEVFRLEREVSVQPTELNSVTEVSYLTIEEADTIKNEILTLKEEIRFLKDFIEDETKEEKADV